jgi:acyl carrier protein
MSAETCEAVRQYILTHIIRNKRVKLGFEDKIITGGLMDSFALTEVQLFIEERYGFRPPDIDMTVENMNTVAQIAAYIDAHRK